MKKNYFFTALALCGLLTFTSCGNDDDPISEGPNTEIAAGDQVIVLDMQDTDVLSTKSRPLLSTESRGADKVTHVQLLVFGFDGTNNRYEFVKQLTPIKNWDDASSTYTYGRKHALELKGNDKLDGTYTQYIIYAVGQDESDETSKPAPFNIITGVAKDGKLLKNFTETEWTAKAPWSLTSTAGTGFVTTKALTATEEAGEIFSGVSKPIEFKFDASGFTTTILLKRQVAGVLGYFNNIPAYATNDEAKPVTSIRLVSSNRNTQLDLSTMLEKQNDDASFGKPGYSETENVVNGFTPEKTKNAWFGKGESPVAGNNAYTVYEIDLKKWYKWDAAGKWDANAIINSDEKDKSKQLLGFKNNEGWHNAIDPSNSNFMKVDDGSVFGGNFVIPFEKNGGNTFELQLISDKDGNKAEVVKTWTVKLDDLSQGPEDGDRSYNIYRNHLYQVGKRGSGDTPDKPGKDPDKPQPLDKDQELIIKINDQWEFVHDMVID